MCADIGHIAVSNVLISTNQYPHAINVIFFFHCRLSGGPVPGPAAAGNQAMLPLPVVAPAVVAQPIVQAVAAPPVAPAVVAPHLIDPQILIIDSSVDSSTTDYPSDHPSPGLSSSLPPLISPDDGAAAAAPREWWSLWSGSMGDYPGAVKRPAEDEPHLESVRTRARHAADGVAADDTDIIPDMHSVASLPESIAPVVRVTSSEFDALFANSPSLPTKLVVGSREDFANTSAAESSTNYDVKIEGPIEAGHIIFMQSPASPEKSQIDMRLPEGVALPASVAPITEIQDTFTVDLTHGPPDMQYVMDRVGLWVADTTRRTVAHSDAGQ